MIVPNNNMRTTLNDKNFFTHFIKKNITTIQKKIGSFGYLMVKMDVKFALPKDIDSSQREQLSNLVRNFPEQNLQRCSGNLKVFIGCPMMCTQNADQDIGICNGTMCTLAKIIFI